MGAPRDIPQIQDTQPVLQVQKNESLADGYEAFGKTLGAIANAAGDKAQEMATDQSQAMYINSVANVEQLKTGAQMRMLENPGQAQKIYEQTQSMMDEVKTSAYVNSKDRTKLNAYISGAQDDVALKATATSVKQNQLEAAFTHYENWPEQLKAYNQALLTDHDKAEQLKTAMISTLHGLVATQAITPVQAANSMKSMTDMVAVAADHYRMYGNPNTTAKDFHTVTSNPLSQGGDSGGAAPINQSTAWMVDNSNSDMSFQGVLSDINQRVLPNPQAFDSLTKDQRDHAILAMQGTQVADGYIKSGEPFPSIVKAYDTLNTKGNTLSYRDSATRSALEQYINSLKGGNYLGVMNRDPQGSAILNDFISRNDAINNTFAYNPTGKQSALLQNKNDMVNAAVAWGDGRHIPREYVQPISQGDVANVENGFKLGTNPANVLAILGTYNKQNQTYVAQAMKNPDQRLVVQAVSLSPDTIKVQDKLDFIAANQEGRATSVKGLTTETKDKEIYSRVYTALAPQIQMLGQHYDREQAPIMQNSMINTTVKYAKYLAQLDNNSAMEDKSTFMVGTQSWKQYVDKAASIYQNSFTQVSSTNYSVNPNQLPLPLNRGQMDMLASYAINKGQEYLKAGRQNYEYESALSRNPLKMVLSPTNDLQAVDGSGKVYFSTPFSTKLLGIAQHDAEQREAERKKIIGAAYEKTAMMGMNVGGMNVNP